MGAITNIFSSLFAGIITITFKDERTYFLVIRSFFTTFGAICLTLEEPFILILSNLS